MAVAGEIAAEAAYFRAESFQTEGKGENWLTFSFASEQPVQRWYGWLTLSCKRGALLDERVRDNGVPFLVDHNSYDESAQMGMVRKVYLKGRVAYTDVEFDQDNEEALRIRDRMISGMRPNVSPMAVPPDDESIQILEEDSYYRQSRLYSKWEVWEISSVSMPANAKVGVGPGKLASRPDVDQKIEAMADTARRRYWTMGMHNPIQDPPDPAPAVKQPEVLSGNPAPDPNEVARMAQQLAQQMMVSNTPDLARQVAELLKPAERTPEQIAEEQKQAASLQAVEIYRLGHEMGQMDIASEYVKEGKSEAEFREKLMTLAFSPHARTAPILGTNGAQKFSLANLVRAELNPHNVEYQRAAEFEKSSGDSIRGQAREGGVIVPFEAYAKAGPVLPIRQLQSVSNREEQLAVTVAGTTGASNAVVTMIDLERTVDFLVDPLDLIAYCDVAMGLTGDVQVPIETGGATIGFNAEGTMQAESTPLFSSYKASPNAMSAQVKITKQSLIQTSGWIERRIRMLLARQFRAQISNFILNGTGANNQPNGLLSTTSLPERTGGTLATLNWDDVIDTEETVDNEWVPEMGRAWVMSKAAYGKHLKTPKAANYPEFLLNKGEPLMGYPAMKTGHTADTGTVKGRVIFGNWLDMFVGFWDGFEVVVNGITEPLNVIISVYVFWDAICARKESFINALYS